jgi:hypothetical protein
MAVSAGAATVVPKTYQTKVLGDINSSQIIASNIKNRIRSACPGAASGDISSCFKVQLQPLDIKSSSHALFMMNIGLTAAQIDSQGTRSKTTAALFAADNVLSILEKVDPRRFHLSQISILSIDDYMAVVELKRQENQRLEAMKKKMLSVVEKKLGDVQPLLRAPASVSKPTPIQVWQSAQLANLTSRSRAMAQRTLQFPEDETTFHATRAWQFHLNEHRQRICYSDRTLACKQLSPLVCEDILAKAFTACNSGAASSAHFDEAQDLVSYMQKLNQCAAPRIKQGLVDAAPACH